MTWDADPEQLWLLQLRRSPAFIHFIELNRRSSCFFGLNKCKIQNFVIKFINSLNYKKKFIL